MSARSLRFLLLASACGAGALAAPLVFSGCQQTTTPVSVHSLERSGRVSFVCLGPRSEGSRAFRGIEECSAQQFTDINAYDYEDDAGVVDAGGPVLPHLYALVTQTTRGEVAVVDTSSLARNVLDENPVELGANFLPIGAQPTAIVSTPGGSASFVGVAEIGRAGIFALPSRQIRPTSADAVGGSGGTGGAGGSGGSTGSTSTVPIPQLTSWPACALPFAPADILLVADDAFRATCDTEVIPTGDIADEQRGVQKLVVSLPDAGGIVVIDAQTLLDRPPGSFDECPVERWLPLDVDLTGFENLPAPSPPPAGAACVVPTQPSPALKPPYTARPEGLSYAQGMLYIADSAAPIIHVVEMSTPCDPIERAPLLAYSAENPKRVVRSSRVSVAPSPTPDFKRYLYATDIEDGSIMAFDVGPSSTTRLPLSRPHPELTPTRPRDRVKYEAPAADILVVQHDIPEINPTTGLAVAGVRCDPSPGLVTCTDTSQTCDIATKYRPNPPSYTSGASPGKLRGTFALAALTSGRLAVIDVDDLDAPCRGPSKPTVAAGCVVDPANPKTDLSTSLEVSCNAVQAGTERSTYFVNSSDANGDHTPGITTYPLLFDSKGALVDFASTTLRMKAPAGGTLHVAGVDQDVSAVTDQHTLSVRLEEPRAHTVDQEWFVTYEGPIPGFTERLANLRTDGDAPDLYDPASRFCDFGVLGERAQREIHASTWKPATVENGVVTDTGFTDLDWARFADYVQIQSALPDELDPYWKSSLDDEERPECKPWTQIECLKRFGTLDAPTSARDLRILEAYQDRLELTHRPAFGALSFPPGATPAEVQAAVEAALAGLDDLSDVKCCFPGAVSFGVRAGTQWVVNALTGFSHHVVAEPGTGRCRQSCDSKVALMNGRALDQSARLADASAAIFTNSVLSFTISGGGEPALRAPDYRDMVFRFTTTGAFTALTATLTNDPANVLVQPQAMTFLPATGEIVITDGNNNGILFVSMSSVQFTRSFF